MRTFSTFLANVTKTQNESLAILRHAVDIIASKDPMTYQVVAAKDTQVVEYDYDPSDEAEIARLKERGLSDSAIYDSVSTASDTLSEWERATILEETGGIR